MPDVYAPHLVRECIEHKYCGYIIATVTGIESHVSSSPRYELNSIPPPRSSPSTLRSTMQNMTLAEVSIHRVGWVDVQADAGNNRSTEGDE